LVCALEGEEGCGVLIFEIVWVYMLGIV